MTDPPVADWLHLDPSVESETLNALHDGRIVRVRSDRLARNASITIDVEHLREWLNAPPSMRFVLGFEGVQSVRVSAWVRWPGGAPAIPQGMPSGEVSTVIAEYQSKWREESVDWTAFESSFATNDDWLDVMDGDLAVAPGVVSVHLCGHHQRDDQWHDIWVRAERFSVSRTDSEPFDIAALIEVASAYWTAFADRQRSH